MGDIEPENAVMASPRALLLARLSEFVESRMGLHFPTARLGDLERGIAAAAGEFGFNDVASCIEWLLSAVLSHQQIKTLAGYLTVGETYFFRDKRVFEILETQTLPGIINSRRGVAQNLRIWSAGCATGEEPYSIALLLTRILPDLKDWHISILATDISASALNRAFEGVYGKWSFRDTPSWVKEGYFKRIDRNFKIDSCIQRMVTFSALNLVEDPYPAIINQTHAMDIILCRNVLMYFSRGRADAIIHHLAHCLADGGWLVISPVEAPGSGLSPLLHPVHFPGAIFYRKGAKPKQGLAGRNSISETPKIEKEIAVTIAPKVAQTIREDKIWPVTEGKGDIGRRSYQVRLLADRGQLADALVVCEVAIKSNKLDPSLHYLQATILQEMGRAGEAVASLKRAIYIDQEFIIAHFALGHLLQHQGKYREAGKHLETARSLLKSHRHDDILPAAEGLSAGRLIELINTMRGR
jgi:chemotaxis protein methyltransferase CheR